MPEIETRFFCDAGAMLPFTSREDLASFVHLDLHLLCMNDA